MPVQSGDRRPHAAAGAPGDDALSPLSRRRRSVCVRVSIFRDPTPCWRLWLVSLLRRSVTPQGHQAPPLSPALFDGDAAGFTVRRSPRERRQ